MKLEFYNQLSKRSWSIPVKSVLGLAQAYRCDDGTEYRLLPSGKVLNGYFGVEIGISGSIYPH